MGIRQQRGWTTLTAVHVVDMTKAKTVCPVSPRLLLLLSGPEAYCIKNGVFRILLLLLPDRRGRDRQTDRSLRAATKPGRSWMENKLESGFP